MEQLQSAISQISAETRDASDAGDAGLGRLLHLIVQRQEQSPLSKALFTQRAKAVVLRELRQTLGSLLQDMSHYRSITDGNPQSEGGPTLRQNATGCGKETSATGILQTTNSSLDCPRFETDRTMTKSSGYECQPRDTRATVFRTSPNNTKTNISIDHSRIQTDRAVAKSSSYEGQPRSTRSTTTSASPTKTRTKLDEAVQAMRERVLNKFKEEQRVHNELMAEERVQNKLMAEERVHNELMVEEQIQNKLKTMTDPTFEPLNEGKLPVYLCKVIDGDHGFGSLHQGKPPIYPHNENNNACVPKCRGSSGSCRRDSGASGSSQPPPEATEATSHQTPPGSTDNVEKSAEDLLGDLCEAEVMGNVGATRMLGNFERASTSRDADNAVVNSSRPGTSDGTSEKPKVVDTTANLNESLVLADLEVADILRNLDNKPDLEETLNDSVTLPDFDVTDSLGNLTGTGNMRLYNHAEILGDLGGAEGFADVSSDTLLGDLGSDEIELDSSGKDIEDRFRAYPTGVIDEDAILSFLIAEEKNQAKDSGMPPSLRHHFDSKLRDIRRNYEHLLAQETERLQRLEGLGQEKCSSEEFVAHMGDQEKQLQSLSNRVKNLSNRLRIAEEQAQQFRNLSRELKRKLEDTEDEKDRYLSKTDDLKMELEEKKAETQVKIDMLEKSSRTWSNLQETLDKERREKQRLHMSLSSEIEDKDGQLEKARLRIAQLEDRIDEMLQEKFLKEEQYNEEVERLKYELKDAARSKQENIRLRRQLKTANKKIGLHREKTKELAEKLRKTKTLFKTRQEEYAQSLADCRKKLKMLIERVNRKGTSREKMIVEKTSPKESPSVADSVIHIRELLARADQLEQTLQGSGVSPGYIVSCKET